MSFCTSISSVQIDLAPTEVAFVESEFDASGDVLYLKVLNVVENCTSCAH